MANKLRASPSPTADDRNFGANMSGALDDEGRAFSQNQFESARRQWDIEILNERSSWRSIAYAVCLLLAGIVFLIFAISFYIQGESDRALPLAIIGSLTFIPGAYYSHIAFNAYRGVSGYDYSQLPE